MARRDDLIAFARLHGLKIGTIADLIRYRLAHEEAVEQIAELDVETEHGPFRLICFEDHVNRNVHLALVRGKLDDEHPALVRVHIQGTLGDVVGVQDSRLGWPVRDALKRIAAEGCGALIILRQQESPRELVEQIKSLAQPEDQLLARRDAGSELRTFGTGAQILRALGVRRMRVLSAPKQMHALSGFGLEVVEYVSSQTGVDE